MILHILLMLLLLTMLGEITQRFHAEARTHDFLFILDHVMGQHLVAVTLEMGGVLPVRYFVLEELFHVVSILVIHHFSITSTVVTGSCRISQL